uniref:Translationally-controlled tumor protein homolog n=2 Tax=Eptatretus burgeri TaxID=7764 RepID=A0A8C4NB11_EPTBU
MIIFKDIVSGDEMFSDIYKMIETDDGLCYEVEAKRITRTGKVDESVYGGNASAEGMGDEESSGDLTESGIDIVLNHNLQTMVFSKNNYKDYIKEYMRNLKKKLEATNPSRVDPFMSGAKLKVVKILANFKDYEFYAGKSMDCMGTVGLLNYREDGITPYFIFFKDGLELEKCVCNLHLYRVYTCD